MDSIFTFLIFILCVCFEYVNVCHVRNVELRHNTSLNFYVAINVWFFQNLLQSEF